MSYYDIYYNRDKKKNLHPPWLKKKLIIAAVILSIALLYALIKGYLYNSALVDNLILDTPESLREMVRGRVASEYHYFKSVDFLKWLLSTGVHLVLFMYIISRREGSRIAGIALGGWWAYRSIKLVAGWAYFGFFSTFPELHIDYEGMMIELPALVGYLELTSLMMHLMTAAYLLYLFIKYKEVSEKATESA